MRQITSWCSICGDNHCVTFRHEPYPEYGCDFYAHCKICGKTTKHTMVLTRKVAAVLRQKKAEQELQKAIADKCAEYGFSCRFIYQSVVISTPISGWRFDYHQSKKTLYHESTVKINFVTGNRAEMHKQFQDKKMTTLEVIDYIAGHDKWRAEQAGKYHRPK